MNKLPIILALAALVTIGCSSSGHTSGRRSAPAPVPPKASAPVPPKASAPVPPRASAPVPVPAPEVYMDLFLGETTLVEALAVLENPDGADSRAFGSGESMTAIDDLTYIPGYTHTNYTFTIHEPSGIRTEKRFSSTSSDRFKLRFINGILSQVVDN